MNRILTNCKFALKTCPLMGERIKEAFSFFYFQYEGDSNMSYIRIDES